MNNSKKYIIIGIILAALAAGFWYANNRASAPAQNANTKSVEPTPTPQPSPTPTPALQGQTYSDPAGGYSFVYPGDLFKPYGVSVSLPFGSRSLVTPSSSFKHEINTEYCALSGKCQPTTIDMSFGSLVFAQSLDSIKKDHPDLSLTKVRHGSVTAEEYAEGAEGEGMNYYFFPLPSGKTLILFQRNISEQIVTKYQSVADFIKIKDQMEIMNNIIASLKIQ